MPTPAFTAARRPERLETERLILRDFRLEDTEAVHVYGSDPEVTQFMPWGPNSPQDTAAFMARVLEQQATWPRLDLGLAIELKSEAQVVGSIALHLRDVPNATVEMGYVLRRDLWGLGLVTEAGRAMIDMGFGVCGLHRIVASCDVRNVGSYRVMEKLGLRREGRLRKDRMIGAEWRDTYVYALLDEEWRPADQRHLGDTS
ncbi:GNAT family N-acetyltransferase [Phenylobacterium sp.]|uniref:GNAT family N-acetyltransferase n=1 Tax=Phenylobacterium sp. TaxID=1871053 RepID=UPI00273019BA|nr:GNAT family protein [Phenylobacterium sp.]MDP2214278.1 GNAT family protein [Phenylobacterium sp.]